MVRPDSNEEKKAEYTVLLLTSLWGETAHDAGLLAGAERESRTVGKCLYHDFQGKK